MGYISTADKAKAIRAEIKAMGHKRAQVSVRTDRGAIDVRVVPHE